MESDVLLEFEYSYNRDKSLLALKHATPGKSYVEHFVKFQTESSCAGKVAGLDTAFAFREEVENYRARLAEIIPDRYVTPLAGMTG